MGKSGQIQVQVAWFYRPEEAMGGRKVWPMHLQSPFCIWGHHTDGCCLTHGDAWKPLHMKLRYWSPFLSWMEARYAWAAQ